MFFCGALASLKDGQSPPGPWPFLFLARLVRALSFLGGGMSKEEGVATAVVVSGMVRSLQSRCVTVLPSDSIATHRVGLPHSGSVG